MITIDLIQQSVKKGERMPRTEAQQRARYKYNAANIKRVPLDVQKKYYEQELKPAADRAGEPVNTYIKAAIAQRIEREQSQPPKIEPDSPGPVQL